MSQIGVLWKMTFEGKIRICGFYDRGILRLSSSKSSNFHFKNFNSLPQFKSKNHNSRKKNFFFKRRKMRLKIKAIELMNTKKDNFHYRSKKNPLAISMTPTLATHCIRENP